MNAQSIERTMCLILYINAYFPYFPVSLLFHFCPFSSDVFLLPRCRCRRPPVSAHPPEQRVSRPTAEQRLIADQTRAGGRQRLLPV